MEWIDITIEQPTVNGKYLVKTKTGMGNERRLDADYTIQKVNGKDKKTFHVSNQIVTHWLKE